MNEQIALKKDYAANLATLPKGASYMGFFWTDGCSREGEVAVVPGGTKKDSDPALDVLLPAPNFQSLNALLLTLQDLLQLTDIGCRFSVK